MFIKTLFIKQNLCGKLNTHNFIFEKRKLFFFLNSSVCLPKGAGVYSSRMTLQLTMKLHLYIKMIIKMSYGVEVFLSLFFKIFFLIHIMPSFRRLRNLYGSRIFRMNERIACTFLTLEYFSYFLSFFILDYISNNVFTIYFFLFSLKKELDFVVPA